MGKRLLMKWAAVLWLALCWLAMLVSANTYIYSYSVGGQSGRDYILKGVGSGEWVRWVSIFDPGRDLRIMLPQAVFVTAMIAFAVWWLVQMCRPSLRRQRGFCPTCGYDLRATPGRCPECGTVPGEEPFT